MPVISAELPSACATVTTRPAPSQPVPLNTSTLRFLHMPAMPPTSASTIFCLRFWATAKLTVGALGLDAELAGVGDVPEHGSRFEERLGRDAPPVEARAAESVLLDECHLHPG